MVDKLRIGVIGAGVIGGVHLENYQALPGVEILAIADSNRERAMEVAGRFGIPDVYSDFREVLARQDIQAINVCLHNNLHMPVTVAALEAGKHVFCEKPMAGSYRDAEKMFQTARSLGLKLSIQLFSLFTNEVKAAKYLVDQGTIGNPYHARSVGFRRRGRPYVDGAYSAAFVQKEIASGGALYDTGVYRIANLLYLLGNPKVLRISGKTYQETDMDPARRKDSGYNVEELGLGFVKFEKGLTLDLIETWAIHLGGLGGSCLVGSQAGICLDPFGLFQSSGDLNLDTTVDLNAFSRRVHGLHANADAYDSPQQHWVAALQGRVGLLPTAELALNAMLISEGIYLSDRLGREVTADEVVQTSESTAIAL